MESVQATVLLVKVDTIFMVGIVGIFAQAGRTQTQHRNNAWDVILHVVIVLMELLKDVLLVQEVNICIILPVQPTAPIH